MATTLVLILHVIVSLALILIVLLQTGKGAEMGASFGGSNQTVFGSGGGATFMSKVTTGAAVCFMLTSLTLAWMSSKKSSSLIGDKAPVAASVEPLPVEAQDAAPTLPEGVSTEVDPNAPALPVPPAAQ